MAGLEFSPFAHINGTLSFGYKNFIPQTKGKPTYSGLIANTSLNLRISRFRFNWNYSRDHSFSFYEDAMYFIENRHETGVSFFLTQFLKINYRYSHGNLDYPQGSFPDLSVQGGSSFRRQDVNQTHTLGIAVRIFKRTGVGISVSFFHWTSNVRGFDIRRNYIGLDLAQQF